MKTSSCWKGFQVGMAILTINDANLVKIDIARDLLDLVMDGHEQDNVWAAYQDDPEEEQMDIDETLMDDTGDS